MTQAAGLCWVLISSATFFRSRTKSWRCCSRAWGSGARKIDAGCVVARTCGARSLFIRFPRSRVTRKSFPNKACAALPGHPLEVFYDVGDVDIRTIDSNFGQDFVEHSPGGSDKRMSGTVFAVAGLLSHKHQARGRRTFSKDRLRTQFPEITGFAALCGLLQHRKCRGRGDKGSGS